MTQTTKILGAIAVVGTMALAAQAQLIDSFTGDLSAYTMTRILNNGGHNPVNTYSWEISSGAVRINTSSYVGIEQFALTRTDYTLGVGYELTATYSGLNLGSQDIGLYIGAGTPTTDVRADYLNVYVRNTGQLYTRGFNGASELGLVGGSTPANISSLFIARTGTSTYELGYYDGSTRNLLTTRTMTSSTIGNAIGFYADVRAAGIRGSMDNLTLNAVPEPSTFALAGLGFAAFGLIRRRR
ncbi:MAG TPA: PEP-CTERM sorting domain-containing protein [Candidatus Paceibacterota bacterium]|nr:PEP-CTERM sorting domain-containing protein [Candidatus Paceibacterota bacterium]